MRYHRGSHPVKLKFLAKATQGQGQDYGNKKTLPGQGKDKKK